jgi:hypothetical protein
MPLRTGADLLRRVKTRMALSGHTETICYLSAFGGGAIADILLAARADRYVENDPEQTFADPGNSRVAQDMRRVDIETEREGSHDVRK